MASSCCRPSHTRPRRSSTPRSTRRSRPGHVATRRRQCWSSTRSRPSPTTASETRPTNGSGSKHRSGLPNSKGTVRNRIANSRRSVSSTTNTPSAYSRSDLAGGSDVYTLCGRSDYRRARAVKGQSQANSGARGRHAASTADGASSCGYSFFLLSFLLLYAKLVLGFPG